jgi:hypothetical protein
VVLHSKIEKPLGQDFNDWIGPEHKRFKINRPKKARGRLGQETNNEAFWKQTIQNDETDDANR